MTEAGIAIALIHRPLFTIVIQTPETVEIGEKQSHEDKKI
jgi:hypothetical protein